MLEHLNPKPAKPSRVVILGAGGFVGGAIGKRLESDGVATLPLTRKELDLLADGASAKLKGLLKPSDSVVMVSAIAPAKTVPMLMQNLKMAEAVCAALAETEIAHLVYISSDAVYADDANPVTEESTCAPSTIHGMMHAARELMLKNSTKAPVAMLRPTLIYGADDPHNGYGPNRFRREAQKGGPIMIFGEGEERRDHVLVDDVARIATLVLSRRSAGTLNVVTGVSTSFHDIAQMIARQYGVAVKSQPRPGPRPHLLHRFFDITNCLKAFPTFHYTPLAKGLELVRNAPSP
ncbi:MAG: NAD(P)-dependent oxidoreductase [Nitrospirota bacterium]